MGYIPQKQTVRKAGPTPAQKTAYGIAADKACANLGIFGQAERREYRRKVVKELTGFDSFSQVRLNSDIDAIMARFWADAGDWRQAANYGINNARQLAFVVKVLCLQLMQLKGGEEADARRYLDGLLCQAKVPNGRNTADNSYWLDVSYKRLQSLVQILDTERRRVLKRIAPGLSTSFTRWHRYRWVRIVGGFTLESVAADYYANAPFTVNVRSAE